jgi:D-alanyl-D-alanine carboxypeptidase
MKLPVFMTYLKWIEKNPIIIEQDIIPAELALSYEPTFPPSSTVEIGKKYKPKDLLESMIIKSDNIALQALLLALPDNINTTVMSEL